MYWVTINMVTTIGILWRHRVTDIGLLSHYKNPCPKQLIKYVLLHLTNSNATARPTITLFRSTTMFVELTILWGILHHLDWMWQKLCIILSVPHNIGMDMKMLRRGGHYFKLFIWFEDAYCDQDLALINACILDGVDGRRPCSRTRMSRSGGAHALYSSHS